MRLFYKIYARIFYCFSCATKDPLGFLIFSHTFLMWGVYQIFYSLFFLWAFNNGILYPSPSYGIGWVIAGFIIINIMLFVFRFLVMKRKANLLEDIVYKSAQNNKYKILIGLCVWIYFFGSAAFGISCMYWGGCILRPYSYLLFR